MQFIATSYFIDMINVFILRIVLWMKVGFLPKLQVLNFKTRMSLKRGMKLVSI